MTCASCRHARQLGPVLCCLHPSEPARAHFGPRAASWVRRDDCRGEWWAKR